MSNRESFDWDELLTLSDVELATRSPNLLAYIGDAVLELYVRERLVRSGMAHLSLLHRTTTETVSAKGQSKAYNNLVTHLSDEELAILKRGRNTDSGGVPKNATQSQYRAATGVECLIGWLYFKKHSERLCEVLDICFNTINE